MSTRSEDPVATQTTMTVYNQTEAAALLGVSRVTLWRYIRDGRLTAQRRGREMIISSDNLLEFVLRERQGAGIPAPKA